MRASYLFTSESVSEGHPDKVSDRISDTVVDAFLSKDPEARVACETFATTGMVVIGGEIGLTDKSRLANYMGSIGEIARGVIKDIGYEQEKFHWNTCHVLNFLHQQSAHIAQGVDKDGAGDQGIMFGYASDETPDLMPATLDYSHKILHRMAADRHSGAAPAVRAPQAPAERSAPQHPHRPDRPRPSSSECSDGYWCGCPGPDQRPARRSARAAGSWRARPRTPCPR